MEAAGLDGDEPVSRVNAGFAHVAEFSGLF